MCVNRTTATDVSVLSVVRRFWPATLENRDWWPECGSRYIFSYFASFTRFPRRVFMLMLNTNYCVTIDCVHVFSTPAPWPGLVKLDEVLVRASQPGDKTRQPMTAKRNTYAVRFGSAHCLLHVACWFDWLVRRCCCTFALEPLHMRDIGVYVFVSVRALRGVPRATRRPFVVSRPCALATTIIANEHCVCGRLFVGLLALVARLLFLLCKFGLSANQICSGLP